MFVSVLYGLHCVHLSFAFILKRKKILVALQLLSFKFQWLFLAVPWVGLQCVIMVFPDHNHFLLLSHIDEKTKPAFDSKNLFIDQYRLRTFDLRR